MTGQIGPGSTIGILGAGQLGRMLAMVARRMGYRVAVFGGDRDSPAGQVCDRVWPGNYQDEAGLLEFAASADVVTYEFENIPSSAAALIADHTPLCPGVELLHAAQNRFAEKTALTGIGLPTAGFCMVRSAAELEAVRQQAGGAVILKANTEGYDGKGQWAVNSETQAAAVWEDAGLAEAIVEHRVDFQFELSVVAGRYADGTISFFDPLLNHHANHILDVSVSRAPEVTFSIVEQAQQMARAVLEHFDVVGVLCLELFLTQDGRLIVNEIAPRPHNSGHLTIEAYNCSQFELQLRTVCGLPAVELTRLAPAAAMANLLGQHLPESWNTRLPCLSESGTNLHLYGKPGRRQNRKMGHVTAIADDARAAEQRVRRVRDSLCCPAPSAQSVAPA
ncbi:MAG: 5-(carboxyamino)imidazole ribonucleotide synthase [Fuerstiella sp.]